MSENRHKVYDQIGDDIVTLAAIVGVSVLGYAGVTDAMVIGAVAGLGGYRMYKNGRENGD